MSDNAWLRKLRPADRDRAERWIGEPGGQETLHRVAVAYQGRSRRGRPQKDYAPHIRNVAALWMTSPEAISFQQAADSYWEASVDRQALSSKENFRREIVVPALRQATEDFWTELEQRVADTGRLVRRSGADPTNDCAHCRHQRSLRRKMAAQSGRAAKVLNDPLRQFYHAIDGIMELPVREADKRVTEAIAAYVGSCGKTSI